MQTDMPIGTHADSDIAPSSLHLLLYGKMADCMQSFQGPGLKEVLLQEAFVGRLWVAVIVCLNLRDMC